MMAEPTGELEVLPIGLKTVIADDDLKVSIYYLECLAQATYLIQHEDKALIVDPRRDVDAYLQEFQKEGLKLTGILETHFHADFVSGHYELSQRTGAPIYFGPTAKERTKFEIHQVQDGEVIPFTGRYSVRVLHTPGHTPESVVYLLTDNTNSTPIQAFTGDTLFIGSCGRPDLVGSIGRTAEEMAQFMFKSLTNKIKTLPDHVKVFPAHGAGSPCGKNLSNKLYSTIGDEKATNPALSFDKESEFVAFLIEGQPVAPGYFLHDVQMNLTGAPPLLEELAHIPHLSPADFKQLVDSGTTTILDTRPQVDFNSGHIPGSINFSLGVAEGAGTIVGVEDGNFAIWVGTLISNDTPLLIVNSLGKESEALQRLSRIGYTSYIKGILCGGFGAYKEAGLPVEKHCSVDLKSGPPLDSYVSKGYQIIDVRTEGEYGGNKVRGALNLPLAKLRTLQNSLDKSQKYIAYCVSGYRSAIASSLLRQAGFDVVDVTFGFAAVSVFAPTHTTTGKVCPSMKKLISGLV
ncbi:uncharacterized protein LOC135345254 [Halichondria panicea]|uniref:uncharacterized protein LOC135345254 n=1 Tax=Halichondria panicea TaxID=6063 RepID=UPI00312B5F18